MDRLLLTTDRDPRSDARVAELVRVGAGVGAWKKIPVDIFLRGRAALALDEFADELADGNLLQDYLPGIREHGGEIYVDAGNPFVSEIQSPYTFQQLDDAGVSHLVQQARYSINL